MCLKVVCLLVLLAISGNCNSCESVKCRKAPYHYREFGCTPIVKTGKCCPSYYDCSALKNRDTDFCHFKNESFAVGKQLDRPEIEASCTVGCFCQNGTNNKSPNFVCSHIDCPEFFERPSSDESCILQYETDKCCSTVEVCGDDLKKLSTCTVGRKTYYEGQKMYARGRCISCICGKDYENKPFEENKHCHRVSCDLDLHYGKRIKNGCIPIYFKNDGCCPIGWRCPDEETAVVQDSSRKVLNDDPLLKCTFGKLILNVGDKLTPQDDADSCTVCSCKTPPFAHCVKKC